MKNNIKVIDLFAGCGGFSCGFQKAGFNILIAVEFEKMIATSYLANHKNTQMIIDDIKNVDNKNIFSIGDADIIIGGPPCQGFSMAGARIRGGFIEDPRNYLFKHYFNIVKIVQPKIFILENVKGILTLKNGDIINEIKKSFEHIGYKIQYKVIRVRDFGIPQARERVIIIGSLYDFNLDIEIEKTINNISKIDKKFFLSTTVSDAISNLPKPTEDGIVENLTYVSNYQKFLSAKDNTTYNHIATKHNDIATNRIKKIQINENYTVLDENIKSVHSGSYGRLDPNGIAPTITTRFDTPSGGKFIHPIEDRTITPREAARIQSFPDDFVFHGTKTNICKQIGNAVPPKLAYFLATLTKDIIKNYGK
jgi:DNA (cytosine-5)-methyltransferase 1